MAVYRYLWTGKAGASTSLAVLDPTGLWVTEPYMPDMADLITRTISHVARAAVVMPDGERFDLDLEGGRVGWDETRAPRVNASLTCRVPTDQALLDRIDPRTGARVEITAGYVRPGGIEDAHVIADLGLRSRRVSRPDDLLTIEAASDEALMIDNAPSVSLTVNQPTTWEAVRQVIFSVLSPAVTSTVSTPGPAVNQTTKDADKWTVLNDLRDRIEAQVYDDGLRQWWIVDQPVIGEPKHYLAVGQNGTIVTSDAGMDRDSGWYNRVYLRYQWRDGAGAEQLVTAVRSITSGPYSTASGNVRTFRDEREVATTQTEANNAAAALVKRTVTRGRSFGLSAVSAYWLRPGHTVNVKLPLGDDENHLVQSVDFDLKTGLMNVSTRLPDNTGTVGA